MSFSYTSFLLFLPILVIKFSWYSIVLHTYIFWLVAFTLILIFLLGEYVSMLRLNQENAGEGLRMKLVSNLWFGDVSFVWWIYSLESYQVGMASTLVIVIDSLQVLLTMLSLQLKSSNDWFNSSKPSKSIYKWNSQYSRIFSSSLSQPKFCLGLSRLHFQSQGSLFQIVY